MITGEIKLYQEPVSYAANNQQIMNGTIPPQTADWVKQTREDLEAAKGVYKIGDLVNLKNTQTQMRIIGFINQIGDAQRYQGNPCIIKARNSTYTGGDGMLYSLAELDSSTITTGVIKNAC